MKITEQAQNRSDSRPGTRAGLLSLALLPLVLVACGGGDDDPAPLADHTVYTMTNASAGNEVVAFRRGDNGMLTKIAAYPTGGNGLGSTEISPATPQDGTDVLASQGSIQMSPDKRTLVAVNAGGATVTSFSIGRDGGLTRVSTLPSGGLQPNAVAVSNSLVYVANVGAPSNGYASNVSGFKLGADGTLIAIAASTRSLSSVNAQPARLTFNPAGGLLAVSELTTNRISVFPVAVDGTLSAPSVNTSVGMGPFGSSFLSSGALLMSEVMSGSVSSYSVAANGALSPISSSVVNGQMAVCWTFVTPDEKLLFTSNSASGTLSSYRIASDASLTLLQAVATPLEGPTSAVIDGATSEDGKYVYALNSGIGAITALRIESDGSLTKIQTIAGQGIPTLGAQGLVAR
ncbi:MAG: beta-propeller fold lactonase family protein [Luteimonas sp.]|nr:beta-propeller fold lactonase family protein [Luteimonas sp.]